MNDIVNKYVEKSIKPHASDSKRLNVPLFQQEETYYCGPASAKMVICQHFFGHIFTEQFI